MTLLSAAEIEAMRATASEALDGSAVVQTKALVSDGGGGGTTTWTPAGTFACRIAPVISTGGGEGTEGDRLTPESRVICTFPAETSIDHNARIISAGKTYEVTAVRERSQEISRRIEARIVE